MWKDWAHPFFFGLYVPLSIFVFNSAEIAAGEIVVPMLAVVGVSLAVLGISHYRGRRLRLSAISLSLFWVFFFQFANLRGLFPFAMFSERVALWALVAVVVLIVMAVRRLSEAALDAVATALLLAGIAFCAGPLLILPSALSASLSPTAREGKDAPNQSAPATPGEVGLAEDDHEGEDGDAGDVFWVLLDAYAGEQTLVQYFDHDNERFLAMLEARGLRVSRKSYSNYDRTLHSLSSSLNMDYVESWADYPRDYPNNLPLRDAIYNSKLFSEMRRQGRTVAMYSASSHLMPPGDAGAIDVVDSYMNTGQYSLAVLANTPLHALFKADKLFIAIDADRKPWVPGSIDWVFGEGIEAATNGRRDFVFLHVLSPHKPFYFNEDCTVAEDQRKHEWDDFDGDFARYRDAYRSNLRCLNQKVEAFLDALINARGDLPIMVIQGDHGPNEILVSLIEREGFNRYQFQFNVLNAYFLPMGDRDRIVDGMSLVNTWRAVLPSLGVETTDALEHHSYSTVTKKPFLLDEVTR
jgi:hypothetical protein